MTRFSWYLGAKARLYAPHRLMDYSYSGMDFGFIQSDILGS